MSSPDLLVLHSVGDARGGEPWRRAFGQAGWPGAVHAPDLPGHGRAPAPVGGSYELADAALVGAEVVAGVAAAPLVVGVGTSGWSAQLLALAGRASALALVDGLGGPWLDPAAAVAAMASWLRGLADDPEATSPAPGPGSGPGSRPDGLDPRLRHGIVGQTDRGLAQRAAAELSVPVLVVHTSAAVLPESDVEDLVAAIALGELVTVGTAAPETVADVVTAWAQRVQASETSSP